MPEISYSANGENLRTPIITELFMIDAVYALCTILVCTAQIMQMQKNKISCYLISTFVDPVHDSKYEDMTDVSIEKRAVQM